jgi:tetratricopeptide (TPR) repeat protein
MSKIRFVRRAWWEGLIIAWLVAFSVSAFAQTVPSTAAKEERNVDPTIYLGTEHGGPVVHDRALPMLLRVRLGNPVAANIQMQNAVAAQPLDSDPKRKSAKTETVPTFRPSPVPSITLNSSGKMLPLSFGAWDSTDKPVNVSVRPLRAAAFPSGPVVLDGTANLQFYFGIDEGELTKLAPGKYVLRAVLSRENAARGEWSGRVESAPLPIDLRAGGLSVSEQLIDILQAGRFYLHDRNYAMAEQQAATLLSLDKVSVSAWVLRGDAFVEQGKLDEAEKAFNEALHNAQQHSESTVPRPLREPPDWVYERLEKVRKLRQGSAQ